MNNYYIEGFFKRANECGMSSAEALELLKAAKEKPGLWANIRAKRARGEKPAKPGDEDYPDRKQWKKLIKSAVAAWQRSEGKNPEGGLNAKGRASYKKETGGTLKAPVTESNPSGERAKRQNSFCSRMCGMKRVNTGAKAKSDPDSRINKSLRKWNCKCGSVHETFFQKLGCLVVYNNKIATIADTQQIIPNLQQPQTQQPAANNLSDISNKDLAIRGAKEGGKLALKKVLPYTVAKSLPGVGHAISAGTIGNRILGGDFGGAAVEGLSALSKFVPGVGTAASVGIGAYGDAVHNNFTKTHLPKNPLGVRGIQG